MNTAKIVLLVAATLTLIPAGATAEDTRVSLEFGVVDKPPRVTIEFEDADVRKVVAEIAKAADRNIVLDPKVTGKVSVRLRDVPWTAALESVAKHVGAVVVKVVEGESARVMLAPDLPVKYEAGNATFRYWYGKTGEDGKFHVHGLVPGKIETTTVDRLLADLRAAVPKLRAAGLAKEAAAVEKEIARRERQLTSPGEARLLAEVQALRRDVAALRGEIRALTAIVDAQAGTIEGSSGKAGKTALPQKR